MLAFLLLVPTRSPLQAMRMHSSKIGVQRQSCLAIRNIVARNPELRSVALEEGLEPLIRSIRVTHVEYVNVSRTLYYLYTRTSTRIRPHTHTRTHDRNIAEMWTRRTNDLSLRMPMTWPLPEPCSLPVAPEMSLRLHCETWGLRTLMLRAEAWATTCAQLQARCSSSMMCVYITLYR